MDANLIDTLTSMPGWAGTEEEAEAAIQAVLNLAGGNLSSVCREMADDYQTSEKHHPDHILVPRASFIQMLYLLDILRPRDGTYLAFRGSQSVDDARAALATPSPDQGEVERLRTMLRMIVSHATGGHTSDIDRSINDICVDISRNNNRIWAHAQEAARRPDTDTGKDATK